MNYPIKTLKQLPLVLKAFRKEQRLTQAAMAEKLGITQQSYAHFEANPETATLERLFTVLRLLNVNIVLEQTPPSMAERGGPPQSGSDNQTTTPSTHAAKTAALAHPTKKKESW